MHWQSTRECMECVASSYIPVENQLHALKCADIKPPSHIRVSSRNKKRHDGRNRSHLFHDRKCLLIKISFYLFHSIIITTYYMATQIALIDKFREPILYRKSHTIVVLA